MERTMKEFDFRELANESIRSLTPYQPGKPIEELERELGITSSIKLASNENPLFIHHSSANNAW
jgi:histidinol-phosphate/aromatic aminotransferase/cobyric acid decarboxylase-like protein